MRRARHSIPAGVDHHGVGGFPVPDRNSETLAILVDLRSRARACGRRVRQDCSRHRVGFEASTDSAAAESVAQGNSWDRRQMPFRGSVKSSDDRGERI